MMPLFASLTSCVQAQCLLLKGELEAAPAQAALGHRQMHATCVVLDTFDDFKCCNGRLLACIVARARTQQSMSASICPK